MCYHIFLKGFLSSVYLSNNNCENYHNNYHYWHYYHLTCPNIQQNINQYVQINIHMKKPVPFKVSKQKKMLIYCPFLPQFCRMKFEYAYFQTINNFPIYLSAMSLRENCHMSKIVHILSSLNFWDKCFFVQYFFFAQKK